MEDNDWKVTMWLLGIITFLIMVIFILSAFGIESTCNIKEKFNEDMYCSKYYKSNLSNSGYDWVERSHEADRIYLLEQAEKDKEVQKCYDSGRFVNESFTIKDYGLNCRKIDYLNDHLMDDFERKDGGYISVVRNGFFTYTKTEAQLYEYVNDRVLATGKLVKDIKYHLDCNEKKHNEQINYFTEEEFVMYYVERCI